MVKGRDAELAIEGFRVGSQIGLNIGNAIQAHRERVEDRNQRKAAAEMQKKWQGQYKGLMDVDTTEREVIKSEIIETEGALSELSEMLQGGLGEMLKGGQDGAL